MVSEATRPAEKVFQDYLSKYTYDGAAVGVLQNDNLLFVSAHGKAHDHQARPSTLIPILGMSKLITAVATLQLIEDGELDLNDKIFGSEGILPYITARPHADVDPRIYDITVEHLLRHTAGWDETKGPIYDPVLNQVYIARGNKVVNIAEQMNVRGEFLIEEDIMSFMMGMPLFYEPGTNIQHSNFGYSILGRVIEELTGLLYEEYVIENILIPAGMWHTRVGPPRSQDNSDYYRGYVSFEEEPKGHATKDGHSKTLFDIIQPAMLDATLGWYSNVYDISRLMTVLFGHTGAVLLRPETVRLLLSRPWASSPFEVKSDVWSAMGNIMVKNDGSFWYGNSDPFIGSTVYFHYSYYQLEETTGHKKHGSMVLQPEAEAVIFLGLSRHRHRKHLADIAEIFLNPFITEKLEGQNAYIHELADDHFNGSDNRGVIIRYQLSEHRLQQYSNAVRMAGYYVDWVHGYSYQESTYYTLICQSAKTEQELDYEIKVSTSKEKVIKFLSYYLTNSEDYYRLSFAQTFRSASHWDKPCHVVIVTKAGERHNVEFAIQSDVSAYYSLLDEGYKDGYQPVIQSVDFSKHEQHVTFLIRQDWEVKDKSDVRSYHELSYDELETVSRENALDEFTLQYLDSYTAHGKPRFSAIFKKGDISGWLLQSKVEYHQISEDMHMWRAMQYTPHLLVAYSLDDKLYFAGLWKKI